DTFNRNDLTDEYRQDRRLVPAPCPDLKHTVDGCWVEQLGHERHDIGLGDCLPPPYGKGCVRICIPVVWRRDKQVTGYLPQCCKNARVPDAPCRDLEIHHPAAFVRSRVRDGHVPFKFLKSCFLCHVNGGIDLLLECLGKAGDLDVEETPDDRRGRFVLGEPPG